MKKITLLVIASLLVITVFAQQRQAEFQLRATDNTELTRQDWIPVAGDFTATDINGNTHHLQEYLDAGKYVVIDFSATWCPPCWQLHHSGILDDLHNTYGPEGTDEMVVLWIEIDGSTSLSDIQGTGPNTQGDWTVGGTWPVPIINNGAPAASFPTFTGSVPTVVGVCPSGYYKTVTGEAWSNVAQNVYDALSACPTENDPPVVDFTAPLNGFVNIDATFTDNSVSVTEITSREWTFESGTPETSSDETVNVQWAATGTYEVTLTVTNANGSNSKTKSITINEANVDDFHVTFEECIDFATNIAPYNWTTVDVDGNPTYGIQNVSFPGDSEAMPFKIFSFSGLGSPAGWEAAEGDKYAVTMGAVQAQNNDWLISPQFTVDNSHKTFKFKAKSASMQWPEKFKVGVSTTDNNPNSFTIISSGNSVQAPGEFTEFSYDLSAYDGQDIYVAIQCVSYDAFAFMVDELIIDGTSGINDEEVNFGVYPNPSNGMVNISNAETANVKIMNNLGQVIMKRNDISKLESFDMSKFESGSYIINIEINNHVYNQHLILTK